MAKAEEIEFKKYQTRGAYHWEQIGSHPKRANSFVASRYEMCLRIWEKSQGGFAGKRLLDLGCGDGVLTYLLDRRGAIAHGIDVSALAIELAGKKHREKGSKATFSVASGYDTGLPDASLDGVISSDVIEHVQEPDVFMGEIERVLKPGGLAVISTPIKITEYPLDPSHVIEWFPDEYKQMIRKRFPRAEFQVSHPVFWMELFEKSKYSRMAVNILSRFRNPFFAQSGWKYFALQYALCRR